MEYICTNVAVFRLKLLGCPLPFLCQVLFVLHVNISVMDARLCFYAVPILEENMFCLNTTLFAKGCRVNWFRQSGGTPEVVVSISGRGEFPPPVKKNPIACLMSKALWSPA